MVSAMRALVFMLVATSALASPGVFECQTKGENLNGTIRLKNATSGTFELWANGTRHLCPLKVKGFDAQPGGVLSQIILRLQRESCKPDVVSKVSHQLFDDIRLRILSSGVNATLTARTQWLRFEQPAACEVKKIHWKKLIGWSREFRTARR